MVDTSLIFNLIGKDKATKVLGNVGGAFQTLGQKASASLGGLSERTDAVATKTGIMTGALGAVGGGLALVGLEQYEGVLQTVAMGTDLLSGVTDLATIALESSRLKSIALGAARLVQATATGVATAATTALGVAMNIATGPIGLVILGIVALVAVFIIAYKHSETFRRIVNAAFHAVLGAASAAFNWIKHNWPLLLAIITGPVGVAALLVIRNWDKIKHGAGAAKDFIVDKFNALVSFFRGMPSKISHAASGMWHGITSSFRSAINSIIRGWNNLSFHIPSIDTHIPGVGRVGGFTLSTPNIPYLASGGNITRSGFAVVGERGPEVVHVGRGAQVSPLGGGSRQMVELRATGFGGSAIERMFLSWLKAALRANPEVQLVVP